MSKKQLSGTVWIVCEVYYPDEVSTGHYMTMIAEGIARDSSVCVICARPNYRTKDLRVPLRERRNGVEIFRSRGTTFSKDRLLLRLINMATGSIMMFLSLVARCRRSDIVLVGTNPPSLAFLSWIACRSRGARCVYKIEDVYPDAMVASGLIKRGGVADTLLNLAQSWLIRRVDRIAVLGRDMEQLISRKSEGKHASILNIPNWGDIDVIRPDKAAGDRFRLKLGLRSKFVVGYAGNLGPLQAIPFLMECAIALQACSDIHFVFLGAGKMEGWAAEFVARHCLSNVSLVGYRPRAEQLEFLNAWDIGLVTLVAGMSGVGVPSRLYNLLAAGRPVLAVMDRDAEVARVVAEEQVGWVVAPGDVNGFVHAIIEGKSGGALDAMRSRARACAERKYSYEACLAKYVELCRFECQLKGS